MGTLHAPGLSSIHSSDMIIPYLWSGRLALPTALPNAIIETNFGWNHKQAGQAAEQIHLSDSWHLQGYPRVNCRNRGVYTTPGSISGLSGRPGQ